MSASRARVLVVDDDRGVRENLRAFLEDEEYEVITAATVDEALEVVRQREPCVAVVDIRLPGRDGLEFMRVARQLRPALRFVVYTGSATFELSAEVRALGVGDRELFRKPAFDMQALADVIDRLGTEEGE